MKKTLTTLVMMSLLAGTTVTPASALTPEEMAELFYSMPEGNGVDDLIDPFLPSMPEPAPISEGKFGDVVSQLVPGEGDSGQNRPDFFGNLPVTSIGQARVIQEKIDEIAVSQPGPIGVAVFNPTSILQAGELQSGNAWSTLKVPIAIAATREKPELMPLAKKAITVSDNEAALELWKSLGNWNTAAAKVQAVLAEGGDVVTVVNTTARTEHGGFGMTQWALGQQAMFMQNLRYVRGSEPIMQLMSQISPEQRWGLGTIEGTQFKGGWGPDVNNGKYLVRQMGLITLSNGDRVGVAIAAFPDNGSFDTGTKMLDQIAQQLYKI